MTAGVVTPENPDKATRNGREPKMSKVKVLPRPTPLMYLYSLLLLDLWCAACYFRNPSFRIISKEYHAI
jgi:hypothetical protein